jgi:signal peptidase II
MNTSERATAPHNADDGAQGHEPTRRSRVLIVAIVVAIVLALDLSTKAWAWEHVRVKEVVLVKGWLHLHFAFNTGAAFGVFRGARVLFVLITAGALAYLGRLVYIWPTRHVAPYVAIALIAGGALGNLHDRLFRSFAGNHGVVDFIVVYYWPGARWPSFNIADAALAAGVMLMLLYLRRHGDALLRRYERDLSEPDAPA